MPQREGGRNRSVPSGRPVTAVETFIEEMSVPSLMGWGGGLIGLALGYVARARRFCTLSAIESALYGDSWVQARMWALAIAVAALGVHLLHAGGVIALTETFHLLPRIAWLGPLAGGVLFGLGMAAVGTCGFGALLRAAGGDLRAIVVLLVIAVSGYMTMRGLFGVARVALVDAATIPLSAGWDASAAALLGWITGADGPVARLPLAALLALALAAWAFRDRTFRANAAAWASALAVGLLVTGGWALTGTLGADPFDPQALISLRFIAPLGESLVYLMTYTGAVIDFGIASIFGVLLGGYLAALRHGECRLEAFDDAREMRRHLIGGVFMGVGGVTAMGCTIGQGITGVSTLALPSFLALGGIVLGAVGGLKLLMLGGLSVPFATALRGLRDSLRGPQL